MLGAVVCSLLAACSSSPPGGVKVVDRNGSAPAAARRTPVTSGQYIVRRGDTLYSIAFRFGWDWKALAARNGIAPPYTIQVGQAIQFGGRAPAQPSVAKNTPVVAPPVATKPAPVPPAVSTSVPARTGSGLDHDPTQQRRDSRRCGACGGRLGMACER